MRIVPVLVAVAAAGVALAGCGSPPQPAPPPPPAASPAAEVQEFVGRIDGGDGFAIALALSPDGAVEAYLCNGTGTAENFTGRTTGDTVQLTSADGDSTLSATRSATGITGTVTVAGQNRPFITTPADGIAGLYDIAAVADGDRQLREGTSRGGNRLTAEVTGTPGGVATAVGTVVLPTGEQVPIKEEAPTLPAQDPVRGFDEYRVIFTNDGASVGNPKPGSSRTSSGGSSFICPYLF